MRLLDLEPKFIRFAITKADSHLGRPLDDGSTQWGGFDVDTFQLVGSLAEADGIAFLCPKCFAANGGPAGTHGIHVYFKGGNVPPRLGKNKAGQTVRWTAAGTGYDDLSIAPSIQIEDGCLWHGHVRQGRIDGA